MRSSSATIERPSGELPAALIDRNGPSNAAVSIKWQPVVLSFSFSKRELETDPWTIIRQKLEPVDVKYIAEYDHLNTTHVVSKRRNTAKVLQALINGKHIVVEGFMEAIIDATTPAAGDADGAQLSALEKDFDANWPEAMQYIPPKADAPGADRPDELFAPDERRRDIFEGYTFIFYEKTRFEELHPVITSGKGKALLSEVAPGQTTTDDFIRYVKGIAGEKGLGEFEDGSEGKGVVVVRYAPPPNHEQEEWYLNFYNQVALRLDHRPVEPRDFLPAILDVEPGQLRRPLEFDSTQPGPGMSELFRVNSWMSDQPPLFSCANLKSRCQQRQQRIVGGH